MGGMRHQRPERGRFVFNERGDVVSALAPPVGVGADERSPGPMGPTRVFEWLLVDIRIAKLVPPGTRLFTICQNLCERGGVCGVVEATLVVDLQAVPAGDREFLLDMKNWPEAKR